MKNIFLFLFSTFLVSFVYSQAREWGPKHVAKHGMFNPDCFITSNENNYYVLSGLTSKSEVLTFSFDHKLIKSEPLIFNSDLKLKNQKLIKTSKGVFILMFAKIKEEKRKAYFVSKFENGSFNKEIKELEKVDRLVAGFLSFEVEGNEIDPDYRTGHKVSENKSFILLTKSTIDGGSIVAVYNADFSLHSYRFVSLKEIAPDILFDLNSVQVDNNGDVIYTLRERIKNEFSDFWVCILSKDKEIKRVQIKTKDMEAKSLTIANNENNDLIVLGEFVNIHVPSLNGVFMKNITLNKAVVYSIFSDEIIATMDSSPIKKDNYKIIYAGGINNHIYIAFEQSYVIKKSIKDKNGKPTTIEVPYNNDIIIVKLNQTGQLVNNQVIERRHNGDKGMVRVFRDYSDLFFIYNKESVIKKIGQEFSTNLTYVTSLSGLNHQMETRRALDVNIFNVIDPEYTYYLQNKTLMLKREQGLKGYSYTVLNLK